MKPVIIAALALVGLGVASQPALAQDDAPRQLGGAPTLPAPATRPAAPPRQQLDVVPAPAPVAPGQVATAPDSARQPAVVAEPVAPPPAPAAGTSPFGRPYVMAGPTRPTLFQVGLKNGQVYNVADVEVKSPLFGHSHLLLDGRQRIDLADVGFYEDQTGHYVRTTLPNSNRETTLRREKTGRISLYATYNTSYASSPYGMGMGMGMGGFGYGGYPYGGFGNPYGGYRTTKTEYFSKDNGPVQNLNLRNLTVATAENPGAQQLLSNARRYRQSTVAAYVVGGGLLVAGLVQSTRPTGSPGISPLFYAAIPVLIVPLIFQSKQAEAQRQAIALYNSGR
ncbi:MAG TPA: hypothetical protein VFO93_01705 [Hymenobacter sp.]|uniref:hypothetical protein n=1 Tax=Hymenobacter sp. TaxID=1898978 RepID=UPI002D8006B2|nr:hypothetical protein [Hymenobacter sp.]HET9502225.1 hypothetical protein [Hymenobacter sp.]